MCGSCDETPSNRDVVAGRVRRVADVGTEARHMVPLQGDTYDRGRRSAAELYTLYPIHGAQTQVRRGQNLRLGKLGSLTDGRRKETSPECAR